MTVEVNCTTVQFTKSTYSAVRTVVVQTSVGQKVPRFQYVQYFAARCIVLLKAHTWYTLTSPSLHMIEVLQNVFPAERTLGWGRRDGINLSQEIG